MEEKYGIIYYVRNKINNKLYIGQTVRDFDTRYGHDLEKFTHNKHLKSSIIKYGIKNFEINKEFDIAFSKKELDKLEKMYINIYNTTNPKYGYNKKYGGSSGKHTEYTKNKMSEIQTNMFGKKIICVTTSEIFDSIAKASEKYNISNGNIVLCCKGELNKAGSYNKKPLQWLYYEDYLNGKTVIDTRIICITTGELYYSMEEIIDSNKFINTTISGISQCCSFKQSTSGELKDGTRLQWMYYSDYKSGKTPIETKIHTDTKIICTTTNKIFNNAKEAGEYYSIDYSHLYDNCKGKTLYCGEINGEKLQWLYYKNYLDGEISKKIKDNRVICLNTLDIFESIKKASEYYKCDKSVLAKCCKGKRKSCGKDNKGKALHWSYYNDYIKKAI